jgi:hypothetical protein
MAEKGELEAECVAASKTRAASRRAAAENARRIRNA